MDKESEQFQSDLLQSVRDMKAGKAARSTIVEVALIVEPRHHTDRETTTLSEPEISPNKNHNN